MVSVNRYRKPRIEPAVIRAKSSLRWTRTIDAILDGGNVIVSAIASDGYSAVYELRNASGLITITTTGSGREYTVSMTAAQTELFPGGDYQWELYLVKSDDRWLIDTGSVKVIGFSENGSDLRSNIKKTLDAIDAVIEGRASRDVQEYTIQTGTGSRSLKHMTVDELMKFRSHYAALFRQEQVESGQRSNTVRTRFCNK